LKHSYLASSVTAQSTSVFGNSDFDLFSTFLWKSHLFHGSH
jgi:hypothetical protein